MVFDRTENEPDEWDPEADFYDEERDGLTIPQVSTEDDVPDDDLPDLSDGIEPPTVSTDETDVPGDILETFWALVLVINAAVLAVSLGSLLLVFEGDLFRGGLLVAVGAVLFGFAGRRYKTFKRDRDASTADDPEADDGADIDAGTAESKAPDAADPMAGDAPRSRSPEQNDSP
ncbi:MULTISPECIES: hypothetical protein [unclassified Natrinema]|uniref:DUF7322 domain-containing protein n=1 Tax=unclassified Natrinema TaxID=2622230 RepID=UPI00026D4688|nr:MULTISPECIES: hypothetical protein [unclassified Natrinema]AFO58367.1 hypothetical protein NJ7G_3146 [Natrinema sp. J7-2]